MIGNGWPERPEAFKPELLRRLALLDREMQALATEGTNQNYLASCEALRSLEKELRQSLDGELDSAAWATHRLEILEAWRQYRRAFERLAVQCSRRFPIPVGQRDRGPRW